MDGSGGYHPEGGNPITKEHTWYALTDKWILAQKQNAQDPICKTHETQEEGRPKCEYFVPPYNGEQNTHVRRYRDKVWSWYRRKDHPETAPPGDNPIISHQTQTLLHMPSRFCWKDPDIAVSCEATLVPGKYRSGCSQTSIGLNTGPLMEELEKVPKELKGPATL